MTKKITLFGRIPSKKNSKRFLWKGGKQYLVPSEAHEAWWTEHMYKLKKHQPPSPIEECQKIEFSFYMPDNRKTDLDNKASSILDLLKDCLIIKDDAWQITGDVLLYPMGIDRENPRCEVVISY